MLVLPYRVKNPVRQPPLITYALVALNVAVFLVTINPDTSIREDVVWRYGFLMRPDWPLRALTSMFLHGDVMHLLGNMLYLWIFGPAVEERFGRFSYLLMYIGAGLTGALLQAAFGFGLNVPSIGASGAIMGVLAAYLYVFSWSPVCVFYWFFFRPGVADINAVWLIGGYFAMEMLFAFGGVRDGTAHFAHVGGAFFALGLCLLVRMQRDDSEVSQAKVIAHDAGSLDRMPYAALETLQSHNPDDPDIFRAYAIAAAREGYAGRTLSALASHANSFIQRDPNTVAQALLEWHCPPGALTPVQYLSLASRLAAEGNHRSETMILQLLQHAHPQAREVEAALHRLGRLYMQQWKDPSAARMYLSSQLQQFPAGDLANLAKDLLDRASSTPPNARPQSSGQ